MYVNSEMTFLQKIWLTRLVEIENKMASTGKRTVHCTKGENYTHLSLQRDMLGSPERARLRLVLLAVLPFSPFVPRPGIFAQNKLYGHRTKCHSD